MSETTAATQMLGPRQQAFVDALRSGQYTQGGGQLERDGKYCCLGVACRVAAEAGVPVRTNQGKLRGGTLGGQPEVQTYFGFKSDVGQIDPPLYSGTDGSLSVSRTNTHNGIRCDLVDMNDFAGFSFGQIAVVLEKYPDRVFTESL